MIIIKEVGSPRCLVGFIDPLPTVLRDVSGGRGWFAHDVTHENVGLDILKPTLIHDTTDNKATIIVSNAKFGVDAKSTRKLKLSFEFVLLLSSGAELDSEI
ncbi:hypothetical protein CC78DRAFT_589295 [Lojkania enalia]|uniref:Uncharacterized protein n=1 Tax=Lojkania enalia TaxID=147567 RepID=A0A9P4KHL4_9PLEO|nr:hypothetical protein CC78DRAFT_589295 [Didymosphaeria enalia]